MQTSIYVEWILSIRVLHKKTSFTLKIFKAQKPALTNFDISKNTIRNIMDDVDANKPRGFDANKSRENGIPPGF